jgi:hypothetical protein
MRIAKETKLNAIMAKSNIRSISCRLDRWWPVRQRFDLALGQNPSRLSEQEQRTETIQHYIQHDPSPWRLRSASCARRFQEMAGMWRHAALGFHG